MVNIKSLVARSLVNLARSFRVSGNTDAEIRAWQYSTRIVGTSEAHKRLYQIFKERGDTDKARFHLIKLSEVGNSWLRLYAYDLTESQEYDVATESIQKLAEAAPSDLTVLQWLARVATLAEQLDVARRAWLSAKELSPKSMARELDARIQCISDNKPPDIALIGNCQVYPIGQYLREMTGASVVAVTPRDFVEPRLASVVANEISRCKYVVSQPLQTKGWGDLQTEALKQMRPDIIMMPSLLFTGLQPDLLYIPVERWAGPSHTFPEFHSLLTMAAFLRGISEDRVEQLFNRYIFQRLGYFDEFDLSKNFLLNEAKRLGFDIDREFEEWEAVPGFFHTPNHPDIIVLRSISRKLARKMELKIRPNAQLSAGTFRENVWPMYPDIAKVRGQKGSLLFQPPKQPKVYLREMISRDYAAYAKTDFGKMDVPRATSAATLLCEIGVLP
jgi:tetratricopeptide (TPR) repeat protein